MNEEKKLTGKERLKITKMLAEWKGVKNSAYYRLQSILHEDAKKKGNVIK